MKGTMFTGNKKARYLGCLRQGMRRGAAAKAAGVSRWTVNAYAKSDPTFAGEVEQAEIDGCEMVEDALFQTAIKGNTTAQIFYLTNRSPDRWKDRRQPSVQITNQALAPDELAKVTDELEKKLANLRATNSPSA